MTKVPNSPEAKRLPLIGWREWVELPDLKVSRIKAKIDTGARTSALHAYDIEVIEQAEQPLVRFVIHPKQRDMSETIQAQAPLLEYREVRNSGGKAESRPVILTPVKLGDVLLPIELTLTNRDVMGFRMLLGRQAVRDRYLVDPGRSYLL